MMTLEQIQASNINLDMAREALTQADKRLADTLANKDALERKAAALFGGYVTGALALTGVGATMFKEDGLDNPMSLVFLMAGGFLLAGLIVLAFVFYDRQYGALGSDPEIWLQPGTMDVQNSATALPHMLAYQTYHHLARIAAGQKANSKKVDLLQWAIFFGIAAPLSLALLLFR